MTHVLSIETSNGAISVFTCPLPWDPQGPTVTLNGRALSEGYTILSSTQVRFTEAPRMDDVVGFFVATTYT